MAHYRESFPNATIIPKMHILERHVIPWVLGQASWESKGQNRSMLTSKNWKRHSGITDPVVERLKHIIHEHMLQTAPPSAPSSPLPSNGRRWNSYMYMCRGTRKGGNVEFFNFSEIAFLYLERYIWHHTAIKIAPLQRSGSVP